MIFDDITAVLFGLICEAFLHGCYTILFIVSVYLTFKRSPDQNGINKHIFVISIFLYLICTVHFALELVHFYTVVRNGGMEVSRDEVALLTTADVLVAIADFIGQLILIYRCWLLWSRNFLVIILPTLTAITSLLCVSVALHSVVLIHPMTNLSPALIRLSLAGFILPLCTNVLVTTLIAARIWYISPRKMSDLLGRRIPTGPARAAIDIVVESGMLYLAVQLVFVTLLAIRHPAQGIVGPMAVQIYGIAPMLIIIRVALGLSNKPSEKLLGVARSDSKHPSTQVHVGYNTATYSDVGQRLTTEIPVSQIKSKPSVEDLAPSISSTENTIPV